MKYTLYIFLLTILQGFSQQTLEKCSLEKDNFEYVLKIKNENSLTNKLELITNKIYRDTIYKPDSTYFKKRGYFDNEYLDNLNKKCGKKVLHFVFYKKGKKTVQIDPLLLKENQNIFENMNLSNIEKIYYFEKDGQAQSIFGTIASEGVIVIYTNDRKIKKLINKIK
jgi:hypothetical protein